MLLGVVRPESGTSVDLVGLRAGQHENGVLNRADGMADSATSAVGLHNLREGVITVKFNSLVARICTGQVAATALEALVLVDHWGEELLSVHLLQGGDMLQLGANQLKNALGGNLSLCVEFSFQVEEVVRRELASPALCVKLLFSEAVHVGLETGLKVVVNSGCVEVLYSRADLKSLGTILDVTHGMVT